VKRPLTTEREDIENGLVELAEVEHEATLLELAEAAEHEQIWDEYLAARDYNYDPVNAIDYPWLFDDVDANAQLEAEEREQQAREYYHREFAHLWPAVDEKV
jgi:hypothetical protein